MNERRFRKVLGNRAGKPHPEFVVPGPWKIRTVERAGRVDLNDYIMEVPVDGSRTSRLIRTHEMAHTAFTPEGKISDLLRGEIGKEPTPLMRYLVQVAEDCRVNFLSLRHAFRPGLREEAGREAGELIHCGYRNAEGGEGGESGALAALSHFTQLPFLPKKDGGMGVVPEHLKPMMREAQKIAAELMFAPTFPGSVKAARKLERLIPEEDREDVECELSYRYRDMEEKEEEEEEKGKEWEEGIGPGEGREPYLWDGDWKGLPGDVRKVTQGITMEVVHLKMPNRKRVGFGVDRHYMDIGVVPKYVSRFGWGPVFNEKVVGCAGGTLLVDDSGSMSLSASDLWRLLEEAPLATVAAYNGHSGIKKGRLRVLARNGRFCRREDIQAGSMGGCNLVDMQALQWLACQPKPRVWVSDGAITGLGDCRYAALDRYCREHIGEPGDIMRVSSVGGAIALFGRRHHLRMHRSVVRKMFGYKQGRTWK